MAACAGITGLTAGILAAPAAAAPGEPSGLEGLSGPRIAEQAEKELAGAKSVRMDLRGDGMKLALTLDREGNCAGRADMGREGALSMVKQGREVWLKPDRAFWESQIGGERAADVAEFVDGRWIRGTTDDAVMGGMDTTCDMETLKNSVNAASGEPDGSGERSGAKGTWKREDDRRFRGHDTVPVTREHDGVTTQMFVADENRPYPLKLTRSSGEGTETIELGRYGDSVSGKEPAAGDTVQVAELEKHLGNGNGNGNGEEQQPSEEV